MVGQEGRAGWPLAVLAAAFAVGLGTVLGLGPATVAVMGLLAIRVSRLAGKSPA